MAINHLSFQGHLVADPEVGATRNGKPYVNFRLAWNRKVGEADNKAFIECKAFDDRAAFISKWFKKGSEMVLEGELRTEEWEKDGQKRSKLVVMVDRAHFCGKQQNAEAPAQTAQPAQPAQSEIDPDDILPF